MGVADLRLRPPPRGGETARGRKAGRGGPDERINLVENGQTVEPGPPLMITTTLTIVKTAGPWRRQPKAALTSNSGSAILSVLYRNF
jgi:hypothetical protein